jgi:hypothetical protein
VQFAGLQAPLFIKTGETIMSLVGFIILLVIAAIAGSIGQALAGYSLGGCHRFTHPAAPCIPLRKAKNL